MPLLTLLLTLIIPTQVFAVVPLPKTLLNLDDIINEFRGPLTTKMSDLSKNYIVKKREGKNSIHAVYTSHDLIHCLGATANPGEPLTKLDLSIDASKPNQLHEVAYYTGCHGNLSLKEQVFTQGKNLSAISSEDFFNGRRKFALKENETARTYRLLSGDDEELFALRIAKVAQGTTADYFIRGQRFMNIFRQFGEDESRAILTFYGFSVEYKRKYSTWGIDRVFDTWALKVIANKMPSGSVIYLNSTNNEISRNNFQRFFGYGALNNTVQRLGDFVKYHNYFFPTTEFQNAGVQSSRFLDEMRLTFTRLLNNTEVNLVRNLIQEYIAAIESGLLKIIDTRPKQ